MKESHFLERDHFHPAGNSLPVNCWKKIPTVVPGKKNLSEFFYE